MSDRFSRQIPFLTQDGHDKISSIKLAIVGAGGLGSHVFQQLSYLGARNLTPIDHDRADASSLNRMVTATAADIGEYKVDILKRFALSLDPSTSINVIRRDVRSPEGMAALAAADRIIGCVDDDGIRYFLTLFAAAYRKPYLDLATELGEGQRSFGGRVFYMIPGTGCLLCHGLLDGAEVARAYEGDGDRQFRKSVYGQPVEALLGSGPSVVSINGMIASLGVTELMCEIANIKAVDGTAHRSYLGTFGTVVRPAYGPRQDCRICVKVLGRPEEARLEALIVEPQRA